MRKREPAEEPIGIFLAGVQKSGTTSMHGYMGCHPLLSSGAAKEAHFFDNEKLDWNTPDYSIFHEFFKSVPERMRAFDATPIYTFWPPSLHRIRQYNPKARLIVLLRDPIERAYSHWAMETRRGLETLPFGEAIREGRRRLPVGSPLAPAWRIFSYVERGFYAGQLRRALHLFPREQILFINSEELRTCHTAALRKVSEFLELTPFPQLTARSDHEGMAAWHPEPRDIYYLRELYASEVEAVTDVTEIDTSGWLTLKRK